MAQWVGALMHLHPPFRPRVCEHWIYIPHGAPPALEAVAKLKPEGSVERQILRSPHLHVGLSLRAKNPKLFRPDLSCEWPELEPEALAALSDSQAMLRLVYADRQRPDGLGLARMVALAAATYYGAAKALCVFDPWTQRLTTNVPQDADTWDHVRFLSEPNPRQVRVLGLGKMGWPDLVSTLKSNDQAHVVEEALKSIASALAVGLDWRWKGDLESAFGLLSCKITAGRRGPARVEINRKP